jgi:hypothetical protein
MRLTDLVTTVYARLDLDAALADVAAVAGFDRYQASTGLADAAALVAERASRAGLSDVAVLSFPADGVRRWWTYAAPLPWTPRRARLSLDGRSVVCYPEQPFTLAANSVGIADARGVPLVRWSRMHATTDVHGAVVVLDTADAIGVVLAHLIGTGALGLVADPIAGLPGRAPGQIGRLELAPGAPLAAFSVDSACLDLLGRAADNDARATVTVDVDDGDAAMSVVTGVLPGARPEADEMLLTAHLCHPRPSANDNASGVAALLGAARVLAGLPLGGDGCAVRFLWCPEFVGTAAYLHDVVHARTMAGPVAAINVDMAGEDVGRCGGPLIIERGPDDVANPLPALAGRCAALLPPARRSYSGAVPADPWTWRFAPYTGGSDHAIAAGPPTRCPVISLGHWPDRLNHSSADTIEAVDPAELRRTATILTATVGVLRRRGDPELAVDVAAATGAWAAGHILDALPGRLPPPPITSASTADRDAAEPGAHDQGADVPRVYDPNGDGAAHRRLWHRADVAAAAVAASHLAGVEAHQRAVVACSVAAIASAAAGQIPPSAPEPADDGSRLIGRWTGPTNLRALAGDATPDDRAYLDEHLAADRGGNLARIVALLDAVRPGRTRSAAAWRAAVTAELAVPVEFADRIFDLLVRAGWAAASDDEDH